jgi:hypothetical protein
LTGDCRSFRRENQSSNTTTPKNATMPNGMMKFAAVIGFSPPATESASRAASTLQFPRAPVEHLLDENFALSPIQS